MNRSTVTRQRKNNSTHNRADAPEIMPQKKASISVPTIDINQDEAPVPPAVRLLAMLEALVASDEPMSAIDLHAAVELPHATTHRLAVILERLGYVERELGTKKFVPGYRMLRLAINTLKNAPGHNLRHQALQDLSAEVGETCNLTVLIDNEIMYIDRVETKWPLRTHLQIGSRVPLHCGASGKLFLSMMPAAKRRTLLFQAPLKAYTNKSITDPTVLEEQLKAIRKSKVSIDVEEFMVGLIGLAVPVYDVDGKICATVSMHAPTARLTADQVLALAPRLQHAANLISNSLSENAINDH